MFMIDYKEGSWWYWLATACLLSAGVSGHPAGFTAAVGLTVIQLLHFAIQRRGVTAFPVQVRFWYLMLLIVAQPEPMRWLYWIPAVGTWAQVLFGYCAMARLVALWPWNRSEPLSFGLVRRTLLARPVRGSVLQGHSSLRQPEACA